MIEVSVSIIERIQNVCYFAIFKNASSRYVNMKVQIQLDYIYIFKVGKWKLYGLINLTVTFIYIFIINLDL